MSPFTPEEVNRLEEYTHLVLHYLYRIYPGQAPVKQVVAATGLHPDTVRPKMKALVAMGLAVPKKNGRSTDYYITDGTKELLDDWITAPRGTFMAGKFDGMLSIPGKDRRNF